MKLPLPLLIAAERSIAGLVSMDPDTQSRLLAIDGKVLRVNVSSPTFAVRLSIADGQISLDQALDDENGDAADTIISGSLRDLRSLINSNDAVYTGAVTIEGDIAVSQQVKLVIAQFDPDWQDAVSPYLGDGMTHRLDVAQTGLTRWFKRTRQALRLNTEEYLQEELEWLAAESQINAFSDSVDELRAATDRLQARLQRLEERESQKQERSTSQSVSDGTNAC